jgi:hypothetical protein
MYKKKKIGQILLERGLISKDMLEEALRQQAAYGGVVTQHLLAAKHIQEEDLAKCIANQFGFPYLNLTTYDIPEEIIHLIPADIAQKYLLVPVDKMENVITVVMSDPFDSDALECVEKLTGCKIQPFVGIISDIVIAIEHYYKVAMANKIFEHKYPTPLTLVPNKYSGIERRRSVRLDVKVDIHFPVQDYYKHSNTKNISLHGLLFESSNALPLNSYVTLQVNLPKEITSIPIAAVVKIVRVSQVSEGKFDIGAEIVKIREEDIHIIYRYALAQQNKD